MRPLSVRVWPRPQARKEHQTPPLSPGSKCSSLGEWWPESAHCPFLKGKVTGDPKPSPSSPRQPSEWATLRMPSQQVCWGVHWLLQCGRLSGDGALFLGNGAGSACLRDSVTGTRWLSHSDSPQEQSGLERRYWSTSSAGELKRTWRMDALQHPQQKAHQEVALSSDSHSLF